LKNHGDAASDLSEAVFGPPGDVIAGNDDTSSVRLEETHDVLERYRFADAAAAHDDAGLTRIHEEADAIEDEVIVE
jgi:hypothetical protein